MALTRTIGPLHLEDLEPHRFEDLIRQLIYDFREWKTLEATGRGGGDDGYDARGEERVVGGDVDPSDQVKGEENVSVDPNGPIWLIQCKREKTIGPKKLGGYVTGTDLTGLYGVIFAAACDFSKEAHDVFRGMLREAGIAEFHLWGKGEIEDMLFQPRNDHLLFAYFGVSLQIRKRSLKTDVRARLRRNEIGPRSGESKGRGMGSLREQ